MTVEVSPGRRVVVSTRRRDEAAAMLADTYPDMRLESQDDGSPFLFRHASFTDGRLRSSELMISGNAALAGSIAHDEIGVGVVLAGRYAAEHGRHRIDASRPFLRLPVNASVRMHDAHVRLVTFDADSVRAVAQRVEAAGGGHMRLVHSRPVSDAAADAWAWMGAHIHTTLQDGRAADNAVITGELFETAARVLLHCFGEPDARESVVERGVPHGAVRRAVSYMEDHAGEAMTVPEVATAARVSVRSLQTLFRRHLGVTPLEHLHGIRLEAARRDLMHADRPDASSVRVVAERWGFGNSGRFARIYAGRFGERPSETLRRRA